MMVRVLNDMGYMIMGFVWCMEVVLYVDPPPAPSQEGENVFFERADDLSIPKGDLGGGLKLETK